MWQTIAGIGGLVGLYLWHVERGQKTVPDEARKLSPDRWTSKEIRETYDRISEHSLDFSSKIPPKQERRYVIVGGAGFVGGYLILQLLARGQSPESIRSIDLRRPTREDLLTGDPAKVDFQSADITSEASIRAAFDKPWPDSVAKLPLTVFHTAAIIIPQDRLKAVYPRVSAVNVDGTANTISAAKRAGADIFIATSSGSIAIRNPEFWIPPWRKTPKHMIQVYPDPDKDQLIRPHYEYFGNYAASKARAEELTLAANSTDFKAGCIRPACGVYGNQFDVTVAVYLRVKNVPSWIPHAIQSFVHAENVCLAHLQYEAALLSHPQQTSGRSYTITDPNKAPTFGDIYFLLKTLSKAGFEAQTVPMVPLLLIAYLIEFYAVTRYRVPGLSKILPDVPKAIVQLQPAIFQISAAHQVALNDQAMLAPSKGGIGYAPGCTSLEGMCQQLKNWNDDVEKARISVKEQNTAKGPVDKLVREAENITAAPGSAATK